ncbi:Protein of unknown function [Cotesia congregata]|uniref:Secreted protein n=1 Tax=Cotesia congregata TaxID=51543 RepID=A0A8J2E7J9_COTCN|nr:Protein of unknown function [Cotesia congregata]
MEWVFCLALFLGPWTAAITGTIKSPWINEHHTLFPCQERLRRKSAPALPIATVPSFLHTRVFIFSASVGSLSDEQLRNCPVIKDTSDSAVGLKSTWFIPPGSSLKLLKKILTSAKFASFAGLGFPTLKIYDFIFLLLRILFTISSTSK